jgi:hypothetical protein
MSLHRAPVSLFTHASRLATLAPIVVVTLALNGVADAPAFKVKEGAHIQRTIEMIGKRELSKVHIQAGDKSQDFPGGSLSLALSSKMVVSDDYDSVASGKIKKLTRSYDTLEKSRTETSQNSKGEKQTRELPEKCDLDGKSVVFTWNAEKKAYDVKPKDEGVDAKLCADLEVDMDYRSFLPEADAAVGAKWTGDFDELKAALLRPGGDLPFHGEKEASTMDLRMRATVWDKTKGKVEFELKATREEDGKKIAPIAFSGTLEVDAATDREGDEKGPSKLHVQDSEKFEGELDWDLDAGRPVALKWNSSGEMSLTITQPAKTKEGEELEVDQTLTFDVEYGYTGAFEAK